MNRKQKKQKRKNATWHKVKCEWLKGGNPRKMRRLKHCGVLSSRGIRISRNKLRELSERTIKAYLDTYKCKEEDLLEL